MAFSDICQHASLRERAFARRLTATTWECELQVTCHDCGLLLVVGNPTGLRTPALAEAGSPPRPNEGAYTVLPVTLT